MWCCGPNEVSEWNGLKLTLPSRQLVQRLMLKKLSMRFREALALIQVYLFDIMSRHEGGRAREEQLGNVARMCHDVHRLG